MMTSFQAALPDKPDQLSPIPASDPFIVEDLGLKTAHARYSPGSPHPLSILWPAQVQPNVVEALDARTKELSEIELP
jgi:hypothetical protein